jgi:hypothetical protein
MLWLFERNVTRYKNKKQTTGEIKVLSGRNQSGNKKRVFTYALGLFFFLNTVLFIYDPRGTRTLLM